MRYEILLAPIQCLKTMPPLKKIHPSQYFCNCSTNIKCLKQNVTPSPYHAQATKSNTFKHVKTFTPPKNKYNKEAVFLGVN